MLVEDAQNAHVRRIELALWEKERKNFTSSPATVSLRRDGLMFKKTIPSNVKLVKSLINYSVKILEISFLFSFWNITITL